MKRITKSIIAVFAITTTLVSCHKDDAASTDSMLGIWTIDQVTQGSPNTAPQTIDINGNCPVKNYYNLKAGGAFEEGNLDSSTCKMTILNGTWKKTNNTLEKTTNGSLTTFNIISSTANKMVLRITDLGPGAPSGEYIEASLTKQQ